MTQGVIFNYFRWVYINNLKPSFLCIKIKLFVIRNYDTEYLRLIDTSQSYCNKQRNCTYIKIMLSDYEYKIILNKNRKEKLTKKEVQQIKAFFELIAIAQIEAFQNKNQ